MTALDVSSQLILSFLIAISQFFEPVSPQQLQAIESQKVLSESEKAIYLFEPKTSAQLLEMDNSQLARYFRTSCARFRNEAILTDDSFLGGRLVELSTLDFIANSINMPTLQSLQQRLLPEEKFDAEKGLRTLIKVCEDKDPRFPIEVVEQFDLKSAVDFYQSFEKQLPTWNSPLDLPELPQMYHVQDEFGGGIGDIYSIETLREKGQVHVTRRNRRINARPDEIPLEMLKAIVAIEDAQFWNFEPKGSDSYKGHKGFDPRGALRAGKTTASGDGIQGASTITMQLVKNFILYEDVNREYLLGRRSLFRKLNELILAAHLEQLLDKKQILTLYLNTIDFGRDTQGIKMAAHAYFGKSLSELTLNEMATLAALPKGPSYYNPDKYADRLKDRRDHVLKRMNQEGFITSSNMKTALAAPLKIISSVKHNPPSNPYAGYYLAELQNQIYQNKRLPDLTAENQLRIFMNPTLQKNAVISLQKGLMQQARSQGELTARVEGDGLPNLQSRAIKLSDKDAFAGFQTALAETPVIYPDFSHFTRLVLLADGRGLSANGEVYSLKPSHKKWLKKRLSAGDSMPLETGDIFFIDPSENANTFEIVGFPEITGSIVVMESQSGRVLATAGGFTLGAHQRYLGPSSNQGFHAYRQPGSTLKPFLFLKALTEGVSPFTMISNTPISFPERYKDTRHCNRWSPEAYSNNEPMAVSVQDALTHSRNLASAHLLNLLSGDLQSQFAQGTLFITNPVGEFKAFTPLNQKLDELWDLFLQLGLYEKYPDVGPCFSSLLGAKEVTAARLATAYATLANGGYKVEPLLYSSPKDMNPEQNSLNLDSTALFQLQKILQNVVKQGTAHNISDWHSLVAGKTGTSNNNKDAWFVGYTSHLTIAVWMGYSNNKSLGRSGTGGQVALPVFKNFMNAYFDLHPSAKNQTLPDEAPLPQNWVEIRFEPTSGLLIDDEFIKTYQRGTGQTQLPPMELDYISPQQRNGFTRHLSKDPNNRAFWKLIFDNMTDIKKLNLQNSMNQTYRETFEEIRYFQDKCQRTKDSIYCDEVERQRRRLPSLFEFYYHNRNYFY